MKKVRISVTVGEDKNKFLDSEVKKENYRNKSHAVEEAIKLLKEKTK